MKKVIILAVALTFCSTGTVQADDDYAGCLSMAKVKQMITNYVSILKDTPSGNIEVFLPHFYHNTDIPKECRVQFTVKPKFSYIGTTTLTVEEATSDITLLSNFPMAPNPTGIAITPDIADDNLGILYDPTHKN
jgi:hypothetical protein